MLSPSSKHRAVALGVTVLAGIASRKLHLGSWWFDKTLGDVLYGCAAYLTLALAWRGAPRRNALAAVLACAAVEAFKLTGWPAAHRHLPLVPWLLGRDFSWHNLACYPVGVALGRLVDYRPPTQMQRVLAARRETLTVADAAARELVDGTPFGALHADWCAFVDRMGPGDALWRFETPADTWRAVPPRGMRGYVLVRDGRAREVFFTRIQ